MSRSEVQGGQDYNIGIWGEMQYDMTTAGGQNQGAPGDLPGIRGSMATQARAQTPNEVAAGLDVRVAAHRLCDGAQLHSRSSSLETGDELRGQGHPLGAQGRRPLLAPPSRGLASSASPADCGKT